MGYEAVAPSDPRKKYGTYERDDGTGLDYAQARYYQSRLGRFTSVDPVEIAGRHCAHPQKLNRFSYCLGNPLRYVDTDGKEEIEVIFRYFIPTKYASFFGIPVANGNNREPSVGYRDFKTLVSLVIETDPKKNSGNPLVSYHFDTDVSVGLGTPDASQLLVYGINKAGTESFRASAEQLPNGGVEGLEAVSVQIHAEASYANAPRVSPPIRQDIGITFVVYKGDGILRATISGSHTKYPAHEVIVRRRETSNARLIYVHDPRTEMRTPISLIYNQVIKMKTHYIR